MDVTRSIYAVQYSPSPSLCTLGTILNIVWVDGCNHKSSKDTHRLAAATELIVDHCGRQLATMSPQLARPTVS